MFEFFIKQVLGMKWLADLVQDIMVNVFKLDLQEKIWGSLHFFVYDTIKILILLFVLVFIIAYIQSYFPPERTKKILSRFNGILGNKIAALLGTVTPFCSCSSVPIFIGFTRAGLPLGLTFSFLISSPLVDLGSMLMLMSFFGEKFAVAYVLLGLGLAVIGGLMISSLKMEDHIKIYNGDVRELYSESENFTQKQRLSYAKSDTVIIVKNVYKYVLMGVGIGAIIHNWVPKEFILAILGPDNPYGVLIATIIGIPIYGDLFGALPIAEALYLAGVPSGTILALMMGITALSLPSMIMLSNVLKPKLLGVFIGIVTIGIVIIGYTFNLLNVI
ncbi:MAG: permease [Negativicutes bacterium]|nr:permease [Negativicutes bacterium]